MISELLEAVKVVGSIGGLASSAFLIYDRMFRNQPEAYLISENYKVAIRFKNIAGETIIIHEIDVAPPLLALDRANDLMTAQQDRAAVWYPSINDETAMRAFIVLPPAAERSFQLKRSAEFENADDGQMITIRCKWRNTRKPLPVYRSVRIKTSVGDIKSLREVALTGKI